jgi:hypothetical protein
MMKGIFCSLTFQIQNREGVITMQIKKWLLMAGLAFTTPAFAAAPASAEYSADTHMETSDGVTDGTVAVAPGKERREFVQDGEKQIMIMRHDKKVLWMLMPEDQAYLEMSLNQGGGRKDDVSAYKITHTKVGTETVNGVKTTKSKIIMIGPKGDKMGGFYWISKEGIVVKIDAIAMDKKSKERFKMELTNLKVGKQSASVFEIPAGYTKMDMGMGGAAKMMMGGGGNAAERQPQQAQPKPKPGFSLKNALDLLK